MQVTFMVQGSSADPYFVTFKKADELSATCTCNAGQRGQHCKHRLSILAGDSSGIVSANSDYVQHVGQWLVGTKLAAAIAATEVAEADLARAKKNLDNAKKAMARVMHAD